MKGEIRSVFRESRCPDTALLSSVEDIALLARVSKVTVVRLCLAGAMPKWREVDGRRYWDRAAAIEAVAIIGHANAAVRAQRLKKIA